LLVKVSANHSNNRFKAKRTGEVFSGVKPMRIKLLLFLILITVPAIASPQKKYIGYKHKGVLYGETLPNGVRDLGGGLLSNMNYGVSRFTRDKKYMLWLEKITSRDAKGVPTWVVKDVLSFDNLKKNQEFHFSHSSICRQNGKENLDLVVLTEFSPSKKTYQVISAWRANIKTGKFEKIPEKGIICK
jgi:hypothetical protein